MRRQGRLAGPALLLRDGEDHPGHAALRRCPPTVQSGTPALIMVLSWRVKMKRSLVLTLLPPRIFLKLIPARPETSLTLIGRSPCLVRASQIGRAACREMG